MPHPHRGATELLQTECGQGRDTFLIWHKADWMGLPKGNPEGPLQVFQLAKTSGHLSAATLHRSPCPAKVRRSCIHGPALSADHSSHVPSPGTCWGFYLCFPTRVNTRANRPPCCEATALAARSAVCLRTNIYDNAHHSSAPSTHTPPRARAVLPRCPRAPD